jgi:hypothetical protein
MTAEIQLGRSCQSPTSSPHSVTSSVWASSVCGALRPNALSVFRLMTYSYVAVAAPAGRPTSPLLGCDQHKQRRASRYSVSTGPRLSQRSKTSLNCVVQRRTCSTPEQRRSAEWWFARATRARTSGLRGQRAEMLRVRKRRLRVGCWEARPWHASSRYSLLIGHTGLPLSLALTHWTLP